MQGVQEMGFIQRHGAEAGPAFEAGLGDCQNFTGNFPDRGIPERCFQRKSRHIIPQFLLLFDGPVLDQIPRRIQRILIIEKPDPKGG